MGGGEHGMPPEPAPGPVPPADDQAELVQLRVRVDALEAASLTHQREIDELKRGRAHPAHP